ncbi:MAG: hypothetical protein DWH99_08745 [Planctomycetota bacterium]|nr:MAG: hypothetical protein DWH99_08745 [Planctomycetota bacterium]
MQEPSSNEFEQHQELERLQAALAKRLVFWNRSLESGSAQLARAELDSAELDRASETLLRKRISQTRSLLPESTKHLGREYRREFREYAQSHHFDGHRAILLDAIHFADWKLYRLAREQDSKPDSHKLRDALRWEQELCRMRLSRFRLRLMRIGSEIRWVFRCGKTMRIWSW